MIYAYIIALAMLVFNIVIVGMAGGGFDDNDSPNTTNKKTTSEDDWYSRRRVVRDKYGREYKVGRSGDYVERSGQWYRVSRDGEGNPYIDDDNYDGDLCDKNNGRLH